MNTEQTLQAELARLDVALDTVEDPARLYDILCRRDEMAKRLEAEERGLRNTERRLARQSAELANAPAVDRMWAGNLERMRRELVDELAAAESELGPGPGFDREIHERVRELRNRLAHLEAED